MKINYTTKTKEVIKKELPNKSLIIVTGSNGIGKTHFLKYLSKSFSIKYVSDNLLETNYKVFELVELVYPKLKKFLFISHLLDYNFSELSSGQKKLVQLFIGIADSPNAILLDEPENKLDLENLTAFINFIEKFSEDKLVIIATHNTHLYRHADEIKIY